MLLFCGLSDELFLQLLFLCRQVTRKEKKKNKVTILQSNGAAAASLNGERERERECSQVGLPQVEKHTTWWALSLSPPYRSVLKGIVDLLVWEIEKRGKQKREKFLNSKIALI